MAGLTANPKYNQSPIANKYREGKLKSTHNRGLKDLKSNSYSLLLTSTEVCNVRFEERAREFIYMARLTNFIG